MTPATQLLKPVTLYFSPAGAAAIFAVSPDALREALLARPGGITVMPAPGAAVVLIGPRVEVPLSAEHVEDLQHLPLVTLCGLSADGYTAEPVTKIELRESELASLLLTIRLQSMSR